MYNRLRVESSSDFNIKLLSLGDPFKEAEREREKERKKGRKRKALPHKKALKEAVVSC